MNKSVYLVLFSLLLLAGIKTNAQGFFNQNGAWIKNQLKQIALWEIYIKDVEKGYNIAKTGLNAIDDIKRGDFQLHVDHFGALMAVNPDIRKYSRMVEILLLPSAIKKLYPKTANAYINSVFNHLMEEAVSNVDQLHILLTTDNYSMTDDERIKQVDKLYADMTDKYAFAKSFASDAGILSLQQLKEKNEIGTSRLLNNVKNP